MSTTPHASRTVGGSREDQVGSSEESASVPWGCDVARRAAAESVDATAGDVATFAHTGQESVAFEVLHTTNGEHFCCEACEATKGAFVRYEGLGDHCERCALSCCACEEPTEAKDAMMCGDCRPAYELAEGADGKLGWFARPDTINVEESHVVVGRVRVRRDALSRALKAADKADTELLIAAGWKPYGFHGYWRKGPMGPSTTKAGALAQVRAERRAS